ncbi:hypothetical protein X975_10266, partial [Stegodyphus mimosarum]
MYNCMINNIIIIYIFWTSTVVNSISFSYFMNLLFSSRESNNFS